MNKKKPRHRGTAFQALDKPHHRDKKIKLDNKRVRFLSLDEAQHLLEILKNDESTGS